MKAYHYEIDYVYNVDGETKETRTYSSVFFFLHQNCMDECVITLDRYRRHFGIVGSRIVETDVPMSVLSDNDLVAKYFADMSIKNV